MQIIKSGNFSRLSETFALIFALMVLVHTIMLAWPGTIWSRGTGYLSFIITVVVIVGLYGLILRGLKYLPGHLALRFESGARRLLWVFVSIVVIHLATFIGHKTVWPKVSGWVALAVSVLIVAVYYWFIKNVIVPAAK